MILYENLNIFADYFQINLEDEQAHTLQRKFIFTDQHLSDRVWVDQGLIIMFTARNMSVPVTIETVEAAPSPDLEDWDHVVEASIQIASGHLEICGCGGYDTLWLSLQPGSYRVRMYHAKLAELSEDGLGGFDYYKIILWPDTDTAPQVLKRWIAG